MEVVIPTRKSVQRINTVVDFPQESEDSGDDDDVSQISPPPAASSSDIIRTENGSSPAFASASKSKQIAIELNVSTSLGGMDGIMEVNPAHLDPNFLTGPGTLLTKLDFMHMVQEGVRMAVTEKASNNRVRLIKQGKVVRGPFDGSLASSNLVSPLGKRMKYILHQYKPKNFHMIRRINGISNEEFIGSICDAELLGGYTESAGKSGSLFWCSSDMKYVMKSISQEEAQLLNRICASYLRHIGSHPQSLLCKFLGMYKIVTTVAPPSYIRGDKRASRIRSKIVHTTRFVIMNNVFLGCDEGSEKFDLKGTTEDRFVKPVSGKEVLKDINFANRWISLPENLAECLTRVIEEDCEFLVKHGIMDYSMIVGVRPCDTLASWAQLASSFEQIPPASPQKKSLTDKLNEQILAAKTAAVKAAHSVQKLLTPTPVISARNSVQSSSLPISRLPSIEENAVAAPVVHTSSSAGSSQSVDKFLANRSESVFSSFEGGVVGLNETRTAPVVYYFGIIDMLQQYTMKKKMAHLIKKFTIGCCHEIDTVAPNYYHRRFQKYTIGKVQSVEAEEIERVRKQRLEFVLEEE